MAPVPSELPMNVPKSTAASAIARRSPPRCRMRRRASASTASLGYRPRRVRFDRESQESRPEERDQPDEEEPARRRPPGTRRRALPCRRRPGSAEGVGGGVPTPNANDPAATWPSTVETVRHATVKTPSVERLEVHRQLVGVTRDRSHRPVRVILSRRVEHPHRGQLRVRRLAKGEHDLGRWLARAWPRRRVSRRSAARGRPRPGGAQGLPPGRGPGSATERAVRSMASPVRPSRRVGSPSARRCQRRAPGIQARRRGGAPGPHAAAPRRRPPASVRHRLPGVGRCDPGG